MKIVRLKGAFSPNPRIEPLLDGTIEIPGVEITWQTGRTGELHLLHLTENRCDIFEFSLSNYLITHDQPAERERLRWTALPIFLSRALMWLDLYVHVDSGITSLADLRGKRVGVPDYHMTAAIWMRIVLQELFGIRPQEIEWFNGRPAGVSHGTDVGEALTAGIILTRAQRPGELEERLHRGELDAAYGGTGAAVARANSVRPLFGPGEAAQVMEKFRRETGVTPTNHLVIVQQDMVDRYPGLAMRLYGAFELSKQEAYARARRAAAGYLLFARDAFARQAAAFGDDPFPSGLAANRIMLEKFARASLDEGLLSSMPEIDRLFCKETWLT